MTESTIESKPQPLRAQRKPGRAKHTAADATVHSAMGELLGIELKSESDVLKLQQRGVPYAAYQRLAERLPKSATGVVGARTSLHRRGQSGAALSEGESERAVRIARVLAQAIRLFGDEKQAQAWLARPAPYVEGEEPMSPLDLCAYESGAKIIEERLLGAAYGIF